MRGLLKGSSYRPILRFLFSLVIVSCPESERCANVDLEESNRGVWQVPSECVLEERRIESVESVVESVRVRLRSGNTARRCACSACHGTRGLTFGLRPASTSAKTRSCNSSGEPL